MDTAYVCLCNGKPTENTTQKIQYPQFWHLKLLVKMGN